MHGLWTTEENKSPRGEMNNDECSHAWTLDHEEKKSHKGEMNNDECSHACTLDS